MRDAETKIFEILEKIETDNDLPKDLLKEIYNMESSQVSNDSRTKLEAPLREMIVKYFGNKK